MSSDNSMAQAASSFASLLIAVSIGVCSKFCEEPLEWRRNTRVVIVDAIARPRLDGERAPLYLMTTRSEDGYEKMGLHKCSGPMRSDMVKGSCYEVDIVVISDCIEDAVEVVCADFGLTSGHKKRGSNE